MLLSAFFQCQLRRLEMGRYARAVAFDLGNVSHSRIAVPLDPAISVKGDSVPDVPQFLTVRQIQRANSREMSKRQRAQLDAKHARKKAKDSTRRMIAQLGKNQHPTDVVDVYTLALPFGWES
jgi:hypothetical protein